MRGRLESALLICACFDAYISNKHVWVHEHHPFFSKLFSKPLNFMKSIIYWIILSISGPPGLPSGQNNVQGKPSDSQNVVGKNFLSFHEIFKKLHVYNIYISTRNAQM